MAIGGSGVQFDDPGEAIRGLCRIASGKVHASEIREGAGVFRLEGQGALQQGKRLVAATTDVADGPQETQCPRIVGVSVEKCAKCRLGVAETALVQEAGYGVQGHGGRVHFAGEATDASGWAATVAGAFMSGQRVADAILSALAG